MDNPLHANGKPMPVEYVATIVTVDYITVTAVSVEAATKSVQRQLASKYGPSRDVTIKSIQEVK